MFDWEIGSFPNKLEALKDELLKDKLGSHSPEFYFNPPHPVNLLNLDFFDSELFDQVKLAKQIIFDAIAKNSLILIHGDYDADGVCATSILFQTIKNVLNYDNCYALIPDRFEDGYGLSDKTVQKLLDIAFNQNFLLITVDCGITSISQVSYLKSLGNKVIISDHHHKGEVIPDADALIWNDKVVGSVLSWMLSLGLGNKDPKMLALSSIATVTDVFPLTGFNRSMIKHGLNSLRTSPPVSIETIMDLNGKNYKDLSVYDLGFVIGPRLNSSGRIGSADTSLELLNSDSRVKALELVSVLNEVNFKRQKITEESLSKLNINEIELPKIIITYNEDFHEGVMGLIASKLVQKYNRPTLVISSNEGKYKGSARSIKGINIIEILKNFKDDFISVGGHEMAAGFSFAPENFSKIKNKINLYLDENFRDFNFNKKIYVNSEISLDMINYDLLNFLEKMEPFGNGNEEPIFVSRDLTIKDFKFIGEKKNHLSINVSNGVNNLKALFFGFDNEKYDIYLGLKVDIAYKIRKNEYRGNTTIDLNIVDLKHA